MAGDDGEFYAVFVRSSYHVEGDERSRISPGHGYPAHTVDSTEIIEFPDLAGLRAWVERNSRGYGRKSFRAVKCLPLRVTESVKIEVG